MANRLLAERDAGRVGTRWASTFVKRHPELTTRFNRIYDYQRAQCEDPGIIRGWFSLVRNTIAKYGIQKADIYNFDETEFQMGVISTVMVVTSSERRGRAKSKQPGNREWATGIQGVNATGWAIPPFIIVKGKYHLSSWYENSPLPKDWVIATSENGWTTNEGGLEWIQHFDKHTEARTTGVHHLLVLNGHDSHHSTGFELYCKENNIITLCMPPHSSHILQLLDVGCFSPLKTEYGRQIEGMMRVSITHLTKEDFFPAFYTAFQAALTPKIIQGGFRGAGRESPRPTPGPARYRNSEADEEAAGRAKGMRETESRGYKKATSKRRASIYTAGGAGRGGAVRGRESDGAPYPIRKAAVSGCSDSKFCITISK